MLHASPAWTRAHLEDEREAVAEALVAALRERIPSLEARPLHLAAHLWRFALVERPVGKGCLYDPGLGLAVCGDGLLGGRVSSALLSGAAAAGRLLEQIGSGVTPG